MKWDIQQILTDKKWELVEHHFARYRWRKYDKPTLLNAVLCLIKTGCQWRMLPNDFPPYKTVFSFYRRMRINYIWAAIMGDLVRRVRIEAGRDATPTYIIIDSQSVKTTSTSEGRGMTEENNERTQETYRC